MLKSTTGYSSAPTLSSWPPLFEKILQTHTITNIYNAADWQMSTTNDGLLTSYGYDAAGRQRSHTILNGAVPVTSVLDAEGRTTSIAENLGGTGPYTTTFGYNGNDLVTSAGQPGGVGEQATYDPNSRLTHVGATGPSTGSGATTLSSGYDYGYNAVGWTTGMTWTVNGAVTSTQVTHDAQGRVTGWSGQPHGPESWNYDGNGNILSTNEYMDGAYRTSVYTYSATLPNEQVQGHTDGLGVEYRGYDGNGDTTSITSTDAPTKADGSPNPYHVAMSLAYDSQARPVTVTTLQEGVPLTVTMAYNAAGQRARYTVAMSGTATVDERFQYRDGALAQMTAMTATLNGDGSIKSTGSYTDTYIYTDSGQPLELLRQRGATTSRYWYVLDGRGNVVALTDQTGTVVDRYAYDPWGEGLPEGTNESIPQPFRYAGYWWDKELGWYWVSVRSYDPEGRWLQPDPSEQDGVRTYVYVGDDPLDATDPSGLCTITLHFQPAFPLPITGQPTPIGKHTFITLNDNGDPNLYWLFEGTKHYEGRGDTTGHILGGPNGQPETPYPQLIARQPGGGYKDTRPFLQPSLTVVHDNVSCSCYLSKFVANAQAIDRLNLKYEQPLPGQAGNPLYPINSDAYAYTVLTHHTGIQVPNRLWSNPDGSVSERPGPPQLLYAGLGDVFLVWPYPLDIPGWGRDLLDPRWQAPGGLG